MDDKLEILTGWLPKALLQVVNRETAEAVPSHMLRGDMIAIYSFPYKIGRESRVVKINGKLERMERPKKDDSPPTNDIYLVDRGHRLNISREHCEIDTKNNGFVVVDRGSACGTKVAGVNIGGRDTGGSSELHDGDEIIVGTNESPYRFRFYSFAEYCICYKK